MGMISSLWLYSHWVSGSLLARNTSRLPHLGWLVCKGKTERLLIFIAPGFIWGLEPCVFTGTQGSLRKNTDGNSMSDETFRFLIRWHLSLDNICAVHWTASTFCFNWILRSRHLAYWVLEENSSTNQGHSGIFTVHFCLQVVGEIVVWHAGWILRHWRNANSVETQSHLIILS